LTDQIGEAAEAFRTQLEEYPECRMDLCQEAVLAGRPRPWPVFHLGRFPDLDLGEGKPEPPPPARTPEQRLLEFLEGAAKPIQMLNPASPVRGLGKGTGTLAASFGIHLEPSLGSTPKGSRAIDDVLAEGMPDPERSGILPEMREDIGVTRGLAPDWIKIGLPDMQGAFNLAHMILGDDAFVAPLAEPAKWDAFMDLLVDFFLAVHETLTRWIGPERSCESPAQCHRIAECSVNMVSEDFYLEHILRYDLRIAEYYGEVALHPCSGPHVFHVTLENLPNVVYTEAGSMISKMTAGSISVDEALEAIGNRPIILSIGQELPEGREEEFIQRDFDRAVSNPRLLFGYTGIHWRKKDEPQMLELHRRLNNYFAERAGARA